MVKTAPFVGEAIRTTPIIQKQSAMATLKQIANTHKTGSQTTLNGERERERERQNKRRQQGNIVTGNNNNNQQVEQRQNGVPRSRIKQIGRRAILTTEQQMRTEEFEGMRTSRAKCMGEKALGDRKARPRTSVASLAFARPFA